MELEKKTSFTSYSELIINPPAIMFEAPPLSNLQEALASPTNPIGMRMRAAYYLRQAYENYQRNKDGDDDNDEGNKNNNKQKIDEIVIETLSKGLEDTRHGSLLRHEFAYVMGQIRDERVSQSILSP